MGKSIATRSEKIKEDSDAIIKSNNLSSVPAALHKVFYISQRVLEEGTKKLYLERFFHPGKGKPCLFLTKDDKNVMEILEFAEPRRSWLINSEVCSNGRIYITTPIDVTFLALHYIRKHCFKNALALDNIHDDEDAGTARILNTFTDPLSLRCIADVKTAGGDMTFYKYNHKKAMAWLSLKTKCVAKALQRSGTYCGSNATSQNYARSDKAVCETARDTDYLRMACDYVGGYIIVEQHEELKKLLEIPSEIQASTEEKKAANSKRKSTDKLNATTKKQKMENGESVKVNNSNLLDDSLDERNSKSIDVEDENKVDKCIADGEMSLKSLKMGATPLKERVLTAKEKSLAKSAKGTKSIASFFTKKTV